MDAIIDYYSQRAPEYEEIYKREDPARQKELEQLSGKLIDAVSARTVLELACGTGYWTRIMAPVATSLTALDASLEMLEFARTKVELCGKVQILPGDAYKPAAVPGKFDAAVAMFWFSHVPRSRNDEFLTALNEKLGSGAVIFIADNVYVPGLGGELAHDTPSLDTYKLRK